MKIFQRSKHFKALRLKNTIVTFEKKPSLALILNYYRYGENSNLADELISFINTLKADEKIETVKLESFLLMYKNSHPIKRILKRNFSAECTRHKAVCWKDKLSFIATSLIIFDIKNIKRIRKKICCCTITYNKTQEPI